MELLVAHLVGDFLLQNHWMQQKRSNGLVCGIHVLVYMLPFWFTALAVHPLAMIAIALQHFLQDRYGLAGKWSKLIRQTPPEVWPQGPLWVDQTFHILFIALVAKVVL